jgi:NAD(P)-dependent dehydrogenase (short-subunit alcohol dehydrogenase family)
MADQIDASFKLSERTALITGPCSTINQAVATKLTSLGCNVALVDRNIEKSQRFAEQLMNTREINERFGRAVAIQADLSKSHHVQDAASRAAESFGGLDIFVDGLMTTDVREYRDPTALDDFDRLIDVNLRAPLMMTHAILKFLEGRKRGRIIYLQHDLIRLGLEKNGLLAATRGGLSDFARILAREVAVNNVTVNVVSVGISEELLLQQANPPNAQGARGEGAAPAPPKISINDSLANIKQSFPRAAMVDPDRVANLIAFLASPLGSAMTGQTIAANQGLA